MLAAFVRQPLQLRHHGDGRGAYRATSATRARSATLRPTTPRRWTSPPLSGPSGGRDRLQPTWGASGNGSRCSRVGHAGATPAVGPPAARRPGPPAGRRAARLLQPLGVRRHDAGPMRPTTPPSPPTKTALLPGGTGDVRQLHQLQPRHQRHHGRYGGAGHRRRLTRPISPSRWATATRPLVDRRRPRASRSAAGGQRHRPRDRSSGPTTPSRTNGCR